MALPAVSENSHQMLAIPSAHGKNCVIPFLFSLFRGFSGLIPPVLMDANILLSQYLYFSLDTPLHPTLDFMQTIKKPTVQI